jgi:hypothetical protein
MKRQFLYGTVQRPLHISPTELQNYMEERANVRIFEKCVMVVALVSIAPSIDEVYIRYHKQFTVIEACCTFIISTVYLDYETILLLQRTRNNHKDISEISKVPMECE